LELLYSRMETGTKVHLKMEENVVTEPWSTKIVFRD